MADTLNEDPSGAMFCIWCDYPGNDSDANVVSKTEPVIKAFGATLPNPPTTGGGSESGGGGTGGETQKPDVTVNLKVDETSDPYYQDGDYSSVKTTDDDTIATVATSAGDKPGTGTTTYEQAQIGEGTFYVSKSNDAVDLPDSQKLTFEKMATVIT